MPTSANTCNYGNCTDHFHTEGRIFVDGASQQRSGAPPVEQSTSIDHVSNTNVSHEGTIDVKGKQGVTPEYDPNDRGWRRIIRNFTPSSVHLGQALFTPLANMTDSVQMVHHHNEHWSGIDLTPSTALQRRLAPNHFHHLLHPKPCPFHPLHPDILLAVHTLSGNIPGCPSTSTPKLVLGNFSSGPCNAHKHDDFGMRASVGPRYGYACVGIMVD